MAALIVMKFGGTSVADAGRIKRAAQRIVDKRDAGQRVVAWFTSDDCMVLEQ